MSKHIDINITKISQYGLQEVKLMECVYVNINFKKTNIFCQHSQANRLQESQRGT